ncbi:MAG: LLM class flavin-dependent oxidoreductase [Acidimicrobiales bacterium]
MAAVIAPGSVEWGIGSVRSQSTAFVQPWEASAGPAELAAVRSGRSPERSTSRCATARDPRPLDETMGDVWYDTIATLGWLAAQTERAQLLNHVYVVPYRSPRHYAKAFRHLDLLSGGRAILGVGIGHVEGEFELLGAAFRGAASPSTPRCRSLREALATGEYGDALVSPRSPRDGGTPIWVERLVGGGAPPHALLGDGWLPQGRPKMGMRAAIDVVRQTRRAVRPDEPFDLGINSEPIYVGTPTWDSGPFTLSGEPSTVAARLTNYAGLGASHIQVRFPARSADELVEQIGRFGDRGVAARRGALTPADRGTSEVVVLAQPAGERDEQVLGEGAASCRAGSGSRGGR